MIGVDYNDELDRSLILEYVKETVFVVDFSFNYDDMKWLKEETKLIWIDHHKSAIEKMGDFKCDGIRYLEKQNDKPSDKKSGCELTWNYLYPDEKMPCSVYYLGRYDVWDHEDINILPFQYGLRMEENTHPESEIWPYILRTSTYVKDFIDGYIHNGKIILDYQDEQNKKHIEAMGFETVFEELRAIVVNKPMSNSKVFDSVYNESKHDIMIIFGIKQGEYKYSLYSTKENVDCSKIATKYGGGGHKGAAGFHLDKLLF
jgi:oligoribonuclease NrnB/cAMP/cGMP phosphodiesterase (DHH superfamily)